MTDSCGRTWPVAPPCGTGTVTHGLSCGYRRKNNGGQEPAAAQRSGTLWRWGSSVKRTGRAVTDQIELRVDADRTPHSGHLALLTQMSYPHLGHRPDLTRIARLLCTNWRRSQ